jgi:hypothetical protein
MATSTSKTPASFVFEIIEGVSGPCKAYSGVATALRTFNGLEVIIMTSTRSALLDAIKEINPTTAVNPSLFRPASLIHDSFIKRKDNDL